MRLYILHCIDCRASTPGPEIVYCNHTVRVNGGIIEAWEAAKAEGYWPLYVVDSYFTVIEI